MAKRKTRRVRASGQAPGAPLTGDSEKLTYAEEVFVEKYISHGNATLAYSQAYPHVQYSTANNMGCQKLVEPRIAAALAQRREEIKEALAYDRNTHLRILVGIATAKAPMFAEVLKDPTNKENYAGLGDHVYAIEQVKESDKHGNEIRLTNRLGAVDRIEKTLGFKERVDPGGSESVAEGLAERARALRERRNT